MNNNSNPFFQYVNNNKGVTGLSAGGTGVDYGGKESVGNNKQGERKGSDVVASDPRKPPTATTITPQLSKPVEEPKKLSTETHTQNDDLKQKRSRSRQGRISKNRDQSQQSDRKEKKEEHFHKTKLCPLYEKGECKKGAQCHFAHGFKQLRGLPNFYKTRLCLLFQKGECKKSIIQCKYAHGQSDLRGLRHDAGYSNTISQSGNETKHRQSDERQRRNFNQDKRKKYQRNSQDNRNDRRDSELSYRRDKYRQDKFSKDESSDRKRKTQKTVQNVLGYKKNIPLNKQYEKFLYNNDVEPKSHYETQNSMYMIPSGLISTGEVASLYNKDLYNVNQRIQVDKTSTIPYPQQQPTYPQLTAKPYKQFPTTLPYNYPDQQLTNPKPYYENPSSPYKPFPQQPPYASNPKPQDKFSQQPPQRPLIQDIVYTPTINSQPYTQFSKDYPSQFYQPPNNEFVSDFPKDLTYNKVSFNESHQQSYRNQSSSGRNVFSQDNRFDGDSVYSQGQQNLLPIIDKPSQQGFYKNNDSFYPSASGKINDTNFLSLNQPPINTYQTNYPKNGVYDLYPALDNSVNTNQSQKYPYPYEKSRFSSFSNNPQK